MAVDSGEGRLPGVLMSALSRLDQSSRWQPPGGPTWLAADDPWSVIDETLDGGDIREAAYDVLVALARLAEHRTAADRSLYILFALNVVFDALEQVPDVPVWAVQSVSTCLQGMRAGALLCVGDAGLKIGVREVAAAAVFVAERNLVLGRIAYGLALYQDLRLRCPKCDAEIECTFVKERWSITSAGRPLERAVDPSIGDRLEPLAAVARDYGLGQALQEIRGLGVRTKCMLCGGETDLWCLVASDVWPRCPISRLDGWVPT